MFADYQLNRTLLSNVQAQGWTKPTQIQKASIPPALAGGDLVATAETGSGKTAAFLLPVMDRLIRQGVRGPGALVLCPTREIALQTEQCAKALGRGTGLRCAVVYGGVGMEPQIRALQTAQLIVATPGRLLDHLGRGTVNLRNIRVLVLDEADRMLDMGFMPDLRRILSHLPEERQTLLFSATMPPEIQALADRFTKEPIRVEIGRVSTPPATVSQTAMTIGPSEKTDLLLRIIRNERVQSALVFTRTKHRADRLTRQLTRAGLRAACIHGDRSQRQRESALEGFRTGSHQILVATDIAARGLDVQGVSHVINYDLPNMPEDYVHRIGRTARAGASGAAFSFVTEDDRAVLRQIEKTLGKTLPRIDGYGYPETSAELA